MTTTITHTTETAETSTVRELGKDAELLITSFNATKRALRALEAQKADLDAKIRELLDGAEVGSIGGVERIRIVHRNSSKLDREAIKLMWPEAYEACMIETPYTIIQAK